MIYEYLDKIPRQITRIYLDTLLKSKNIDRTSQFKKKTINRIGETAMTQNLGQLRK